MVRRKDVAAFILAGGASSRIGHPKGLIKFAGESIILRTVKLVEPLVASVRIIGPAEPYRTLGFATIPDQIPGFRQLRAYQGPLGGILTALSVSSARWNLMLACDLPYLSREWVEDLLERARQSSAQAFVPFTPGGLEPLAAVYRSAAFEDLVAAFREGVRKVTDALDRISLETVAAAELGNSEDSDMVLKNMNTPEDVAAAQKWWTANRPLPSKLPKTLSSRLKKRRAPRRSK